MIWVFLFAWVVFPALMLVLSAGAGLAVQRLTGRVAVPPLLVLPVGLATLVVLCGFFCYYASLAPLSGPVCAVVGIVGLALARRRLAGLLARRGRGLDPWALAAAFGAFAVVGAPIVLSGKPGFTGYGHIVDISFELDLAAHFADAGRSIPAVTNSAYQLDVAKYLLTGYPGGGPWTLGALSNLTPIDLSWLYQPFLAVVAAMSALSLYSLLARVTVSRSLRALGAFVAAQPNVLLAYVYAGGIKELCTSCFMLLLAALLAQVQARPRPGRGVLAIPIALAAMFASLSLTIVPWLGVLGAGVALTVIVWQRDRILTLLAGVQIAAAAAVLSLPTLAVSFKLLPLATGPGLLELGALSQPVPTITAAGVWIGADYRYPQDAHRLPSEVVAVLVLALAACGVVLALRRRAWSLAWLGLAGLAASIYVEHRYGPWVQFKADCLTSPIALLLAFAGVAALAELAGRRLPRWPALLLGGAPALVVAAAVLAGTALLYHDTTLAPYSRLHDLEYIGKRFAGQGPTLTPDFEEYAEYYLRDEDEDSMVNGPRLELRPNVNRAVTGIFAYDLDEYPLDFVESFRTIVMRRNPLASRPPSNYRLVYLSGYYEVWQRDAPARSVYALEPLAAGAPHENVAPCRRMTAAARRLGTRAKLAYMPEPSGYVAFDDADATLSGGFIPSGQAIVAEGAGRAVGEQAIARTARYDFFIEGSFGRPVDVYVDGHHVGTAAYQFSYPNEWIEIATRKLSAGRHRIELRRGGVSLHAGNGDGIDPFNHTIGPLVIIPAGASIPPVRYASPAALRGLCASDQAPRWIEITRSA